MAFKSGHTVFKAVRCACVCVCIDVALVFLMSVNPSSLGSARRVQLGKNLMAQVQGLVDSLMKTGASAPAARAARLWAGSRSRGLAHGRVLQGLGWHFPSIHLTPLMSCYQGWGPSRKRIPEQIPVPYPIVFTSHPALDEHCIPGLHSWFTLH